MPAEGDGADARLPGRVHRREADARTRRRGRFSPGRRSRDREGCRRSPCAQSRCRAGPLSGVRSRGVRRQRDRAVGPTRHCGPSRPCRHRDNRACRARSDAGAATAPKATQAGRGMTPRFRHVNVRRRVVRSASASLAGRGVQGLTAFARAERLSKREAAFRLGQLAHFHRAAELRLGHRIRATALIRAVIKKTEVSEDLCQWLARQKPRDDGPAWAAFAYAALLIARERRDRGQVFTPEPIARAMADWAIQSKDARVLDPGSGPGQLLASAAARLRKLGVRAPAAQLVGVELSALAPTFAALALAPRRGRPRVDQADFLTTFKARTKSFDAVIANPPYWRHHALTRVYKEEIGELADRLVGTRVHRSSGIYVHFLLRSLALLKVGGRLAFLTPREFCDPPYVRSLRAHLLARSRLRALIVFDPVVTAAFDGVLTTSAITLLERGKPDRAPVRVVHVRRIPTSAQLTAALRTDARPGERAWGRVENVPYETVSSATRWSSLLSGEIATAERGRHVRLGELVDVKRGIATGANAFFVLSKAAAEENGLRNGSLRPGIARGALVNQRPCA